MILLRRHRTSFYQPKEKKNKYTDVSWDYNGWQGMATKYNPHNFQPMVMTQRDWTQTLITKINQCSAQIHKQSLIGGADVIECGTNIEAIFNDLEYYNSSEKQIGSRYSVEFKDELQSRIKIYNRKRPDLVYYVNIRGIRAFDYIPETKTNRRLLLCRKKK